MDWIIFLVLSVLCLITSIILSVFRGKTINGSRSRTLFIGVVVSAVLLFIPVYMNTFKLTDCGIFETVLIAVHNMIRLFIVDGEFEFVVRNLPEDPMIFRCYSVMFAILFVLAPVLTFGFVLSFFKNASAYRRYISNYGNDVYVFSSLNEKSFVLAKSLYDGNKKRLIVFTDVFEKEEEEGYELIEKARQIGAICFKKDIATVNFALHSKKAKISLFAIGEDHSENIGQALKLIEKFKYRDNTDLYVFSTQVEAELLLSSAIRDMTDNIKIKVRRINEVRSLINRNLYENGYEMIFKSAYDDGSDVKKINALVVGMGQHGTEMIKSLSWFCQMTGYLPEINAFDVDSDADQKFISLCPELMAYNGRTDVKGDAAYTINIHPGINVLSASFDRIVASLSRVTYVFVALGNDEMNISVAVKLRTIFERMGYSPVIQAVVYNSDKKEALTGITNFKGQSYDVDFIGDMNSSYSEAVILDSDVEEEALKRHLMWGQEDEFWRFDYNYKSSVASAIHRKMKLLCGVPGADKAPADRTEPELWNLRILEHCRWNAYMRSEGYVYGGTVEKSGRNDLAKKHNCLVPFDELPLKEQEKDDD